MGLVNNVNVTKLLALVLHEASYLEAWYSPLPRCFVKLLAWALHEPFT